MTGRDLLDAIGYVDENLLEHCQQTEQKTARNGVSWSWYGKKHVSLAACACLFLIVILGLTFRQSDFYGVGDMAVKGNTQSMTASIGIYSSEERERLPKTETKDEADSGSTGDNFHETGQESETSSVNGETEDTYQPAAVGLPDTDIPTGAKSGADTTPKESGNTDIPPSPDTQLAKVDETDNIIKNYSQGVKIEAIKEIPKGDPSSGELVQPETLQPAKGISAKKILAEHTVIMRGTVKQVRYFHATGGELDVYFSIVSLKVKEVYRADGSGNPQKGSICKVYLPGTKGSFHSESSVLGKLAKGSEVILLPFIADEKTGIHNKENFFAFWDVSDYYFQAKTADSHIFLKTKAGVLYNPRVYDIPYTGKRVTLNDVGNYLKKMIKNSSDIEKLP